MNKSILVILLLLISAPALALNKWNYMVCTGADNAGFPVTLTAYSDSDTVTINGDNLRIVGKTLNGQGVVTENFITTTGVLVYDSLVPFSNTALNAYQFNAVTQNLLAKATLYCKFYGNSESKSKVIAQEIFRLINHTNKFTSINEDSSVISK